jgi:hypothetical protein
MSDPTATVDLVVLIGGSLGASQGRDAAESIARALAS